MKAVLEFDLPDDDMEHKMALKGSSYYCDLSEIANLIRNHRKYESTKTDSQLIDEISEIAWGAIE